MQNAGAACESPYRL